VSSAWSVLARLAYLSMVARALRHVHQRGLIHRDLTPDNLLFERRTGRPRVANFDLSRVEGQKSVMEHAQRTLSSRRSPYAAPEVLAAREPSEIDAGCDVYSLGVVAFEVLTGSLPTTSVGENGRVLAALGLSQEFAQFLARTLSRDAALRPTSAEVLDVFQREASSDSAGTAGSRS
jgi:serine/threonine protein kinase